MNRKDLQGLSRTRLNEAKALLGMKYPDGTYYLAGYAVECALKACIARATVRYDFPDKKKVDASHTHGLKELVKVANLEEALLEQSRRDVLFRDSWDVVRSWSELSRYTRHSIEEAKELVSAIDDRRHGVMVWIMRHW